MTLTDRPTPLEASTDADLWLSFADEVSQHRTLDRVRRQPGVLTVWLTDLPVRFDPQREAVLWEVALRARTLVVPSRCALARVLASGVVHPGSVVVVPLPTRLEPSRTPVVTPGGGAPRVVTPTALYPWERIDLVLDALAGLKRRSLDVRYQVVVDPSSHRSTCAPGTSLSSVDAMGRWEFWQQRAERLGLADRVEWLLDADPLGAMATAQVVVLPWECDDLVASQALVDAISLSVPVVAASFPHAVELAPTGAVTLWRADSRQALERALQRVLTRPLLRTAMRHAARQAARPHAPTAVHQRLAQLAIDLPRGHW